MIPIKTRGNGAVAIALGKGSSKHAWTGMVDGEDVHIYSRDSHRATGRELEDVADRVERLLKKHSDIKNDANPGYVVCSGYPLQSLYWGGVRRYLKLKEVLRALPKGSIHGGFNGALGVVGAACALAWRPRDRTWEIITYRRKERIGTKRLVDERSVVEMDRRFPDTFSNYDPVHDRVLITPRTPCPILFGIRSDDPSVLFDAARAIRSEEWDTCILYLTNQATDDHILRTSIPRVERYTSVRVNGAVACAPGTITGGHVIFSLRDAHGKRVDCAAYEPTKGFRDVVRALVTGDRVCVQGGVRKEPITINLERIDVVKLVTKRLDRPVCCSRRMESMGRAQGFRCRVCRKRSDRMVEVELKRNLKPGIYHVPLCATRHISMTEKRRVRKEKMEQRRIYHQN
jgi:tRNA(Ile2)-agmatinylcytidine synthase